jgi:hypothetical protein
MSNTVDCVGSTSRQRRMDGDGSLFLDSGSVPRVQAGCWTAKERSAEGEAREEGSHRSSMGAMKGQVREDEYAPGRESEEGDQSSQWSSPPSPDPSSRSTVCLSVCLRSEPTEKRRCFFFCFSFCAGFFKRQKCPSTFLNSDNAPRCSCSLFFVLVLVLCSCSCSCLLFIIREEGQGLHRRA